MAPWIRAKDEWGAARPTIWKEIFPPVIPGWSEGPDPESRDSGFGPADRPGMTATPSLLVPKIRLDRAVHFDRQRIAVTVLGIARGDADPAFADAIFLDIGFFDTLEADADVARQDALIVIGAARIDRQTVRKRFILGCGFLVHSRASISFFNPWGAAVGACRATTLPMRSTRN